MSDKLSTEVSRPRRARTDERAAGAASRPDAGLLVMCAMVGMLLLVTFPASAAGLSLLATLNASDAPTQTSAQEPQGESRLQSETPGVKRPVKVNARPFKDLLARAAQMHARGEIDLSGTLEMVVEGDRNDDGSLDNIIITGAAASNPKLLELAREAVIAISDSRMLSFLEDARHLRLTLRLDPQTVAAQALTELESSQRAAERARGYNALLAYGRIAKKGQPEAEVWNNMTVSANGKQLVMRLEMSREAAGNLLFKNITPN